MPVCAAWPPKSKDQNQLNLICNMLYYFSTPTTATPTMTTTTTTA